MRTVLVTGLALCAAAPMAAAQDGEYGVLVDEPGAEATYYTCAACHSERLVAQQGLTRERWEKIVKMMIDDHGMPEPPEEELVEILDYLAAHYGTDRPNFPRN